MGELYFLLEEPDDSLLLELFDEVLLPDVFPLLLLVLLLLSPEETVDLDEPDLLPLLTLFSVLELGLPDTCDEDLLVSVRREVPTVELLLSSLPPLLLLVVVLRLSGVDTWLFTSLPLLLVEVVVLLRSVVEPWLLTLLSLPVVASVLLLPVVVLCLFTLPPDTVEELPLLDWDDCCL